DREAAGVGRPQASPTPVDIRPQATEPPDPEWEAAKAPLSAEVQRGTWDKIKAVLAEQGVPYKTETPKQPYTFYSDGRTYSIKEPEILKLYWGEKLVGEIVHERGKN